MQITKTNITNEVALLGFEADLCSCNRVTNDLEINKDGKRVNKGATVSIPVFDITQTNGLKTNRERIRRYLQSVGISFNNAYLVAAKEVDDIMAKCQEFVDMFNHEKALLIASYPQLLQEFIDNYSVDEVKPIIEKLAYSPEVFEGKHSLEMLPAMVIGAADPSKEQELSEKISDAAYEDVRQSALKIHRERLQVGKTAALVTFATQTVVKDLNALKDKVTKLSFLHEGLGNLIKGFDKVLSTLPKTGKIEGAHLTNVVYLVHTLRDKDMMQGLADGSKSIEIEDAASSWVDDENLKKETTVQNVPTSQEIPQTPTPDFDDDSQEQLFEDWD